MMYKTLMMIILLLMASCEGRQPGGDDVAPAGDGFVPDWAKGVIWYQIFPGRFRNGDPANDPDLASQKGCWPHELREPWEVHPWGSDWYAMQPYEQANGEDIWYNITRRRYGGDLQGIIDKLDYLRDLGVEAVYLNPLFMAPSHHKYDIASYHHIDPHFGPDPEGDRRIIAGEIPDDPSTWQWTAADRLALHMISEMHERGIRVIFDGVFNHVGHEHFAMADLREKQEDSRFRDWFTVHSWEDEEAGTSFEYEGWWGIRDMPELREDSTGIVTGPREYLYAVTRRWMDPEGNSDVSKGIDGWRLDVAYEVKHPFWKDWRRLVRSINAEAYLVGEVIDSPEALKAWLAGDEFDAVMNYNFQFLCSEFFINKGLTPSVFDEKLSELRNAFPPGLTHAMQNLLGSHDTDRLSSRIKNKGLASFLDWEAYFERGKARNPAYKTFRPSVEDYAVLRLMAAFQFTYPGSPMIYYGDEAGMWGAGDPDCRKPMLWDDISYSDEIVDAAGNPCAQTSRVAPDNELIDYYAGLCRIRKAHPALRTGDFRTILADDERGLYGFERRLGDDMIIALFNNSDKGAMVEIACGAGGLEDALGGRAFPCRDGIAGCLLPPVSALILISDKELEK